ncbi:hypothetical protein CBR_g12576 [Chara braunii]|uniref:Uncharacterized protein n=1 Tax=Chara braunii TaxID=69332 RepID=A0A388KS38_CHABU|nr:hypothetical protein CBR_g12576 [Chara braunii]|eukprot:GBG72857.1 hypothetical protein CBR_g12576 [Chara braunii]
MELRRQVADKQVNEDVILAQKEEIGELKQSVYMKINFEKEIVGLRKEVNSLRDQTEHVMAEVGQWKKEALRPDNKRGSVTMQTPDCSNRGTPKPRRSDNVRESEQWKEEYCNLRSLHRLANIEAEALKEKRVEAEMKRMEAEKHVKTLKEQMSRLMAGGDKANVSGATNLKERLEEVAVRSARKGLKVMPGRAVDSIQPATEDRTDSVAKKPASATTNDRVEFVEQKRQLRMLRKIGLEPLCKEEGVKLDKFEETICELAKARARKAFGDDKGWTSKQIGEIHEMSDDASKEVSNTDDEDGRSVEL